MATKPKARNRTPAWSGSGESRSTSAPDRYLELVSECPLRLLRCEPDYRQAIAMLDCLSDLGAERTEAETDYLLSLCVLVEKYEDEHHPMPAVSGAEMLRYLRMTHRSSQTQLAASTGMAVSTISEILSGRRRLAIKHIDLLARYFGVKQSLFLDE